ncbi:hypothetical protein [Cohnella cellulosilytica]|uniref:Uncharacterized protein n=1 Tax=Cohnella cellulosilytica TaxID=986710 RepID=A0ABW2FGY3_9BACL
MKAMIERAIAVETEMIRDVQFGPFHILGVPHIELTKPTPTGEFYIREAHVDLKLAEICEYLEAANKRIAQYDEF